MKKYMFLHIEKTAGTSLVSYLRSVAGDEKFKYVHPIDLDDGFANNELQASSIIAGHIKYNHMMKHMKDYYKITFLRDPVARVISFYNFAKEVPITVDPITSKSKELDIIDFLHFCDEVNERRFVNGTTYKLSDKSGADELENAKKNLLNIDFVGVQERFDESVNMLAYLNNWELPETIPYANKTKNNKKKKEELSDDALELIIKLNQDDIELYDYGLQLYNEKKDIIIMELIQKHKFGNKE